MSRTEPPIHPLRRPDAALIAALAEAVPGGVLGRATDRLSYAHDASHYLLTPEAVVRPRTARDVSRLLRATADAGVALTFRSGGTSLSGQAVSSGVLVDTRHHFRDVEVLDGGLRVRVQPGATVRSTNARLVPFGRKLGPDPASESAATIGGVVANNSSGMTCGTEANAYRTLESAVVVLPSGTIINTARSDVDHELHALEPTLYAGLLRLRDRVRADADSVRTIRRLFALKNTMGYSLNAFLDHDHPVDILLHLIVGSEGTLAFVAEATFKTVPLHRHVATGLLIFQDLSAAAAALPELVATELSAIELLDARSLAVSQANPQAPAVLRRLQVRDHAALLVEHQEPDAERLADRVDTTGIVLARLKLAEPGVLATEAQLRADLWHVRKGLFSAVAGARPSGTTALLEDVAVPVPALAQTCQELAGLFDLHRYEGSVIFGHAKDGNIHFLINERFDRPGSVERYVRFTEDMVDLVLTHGGTLKAEHGTGRIMAPFVRRQYGDELFHVMRDLRDLFDPNGLLNPGVLLSDDADSYVRDLKVTPTVEREVDRCVECGFCEPVCPSKEITTTPRQRIVLRREMERAKQVGDRALVKELEQSYRYDAVETCAADGMCQTACPVLIDTGDLTRRLRSERTTPISRGLWTGAAKHWDGATRCAAAALTVAATVPRISEAVTRVARAALPDELVPLWTRDLPRGGTRRLPLHSANPVAVFFPSCTSTVFGVQGSPGAAASFLALCHQGEVGIRVPREIASLCCGTPWKSKGQPGGYGAMRSIVESVLLRDTRGGSIPVVVDATSCTEGLRSMVAEEPRIRVRDAVEFVDHLVLPHLRVSEPFDSLFLHPTCSSARLGIDRSLTRLAEACAKRVVVPDSWGCCAFAGDRGLLHPELTHSATESEAREAIESGASAFASLNRTCEMGLSRATGRTYRHILEIVLEASRP